MSYWTGYSGTGLVLDACEFYAMIARYRTLNPGQAKYMDDAVEDAGFNAVVLVKSAYAGTVGEDVSALADTNELTDELAAKTLGICELTDDHAEGVTFWPFYRSDGMMNTHANAKENGGLESRLIPVDGPDGGAYVFFADMSMSGPMAFERKPYASYSEFIREFMDKLGAYLPQDFDWNSHLGNVAYACYA